jgi:hypothetical protein
MLLRYGRLARRSGQGCFTVKPVRAGPRASRGCARCLRRPSGEARSCLLNGRSLDLNYAHQASAACADDDYQPSLGVLGVPLIMVLDNKHIEAHGKKKKRKKCLRLSVNQELKKGTFSMIASSLKKIKGQNAVDRNVAQRASGHAHKRRHCLALFRACLVCD